MNMSLTGSVHIHGVKIITLVCLVLLSACSQLPVTESLAHKDIDYLFSGEAIFGEDTKNTELPDDDIFEITDEMREFLHHTIPTRGNPLAKIKALAKAIHSDHLLDFTYDTQKTFGAKETFSRSTGNCLSHAILFITLARELGFKAQFNEVEVPQTWGLQGETTLVLYRHVNTAVFLRHRNRHIIDITPEIYRSEYPQKIISDDYAEAQYYNNLAVNFMSEKKLYEAFRHFKKALTLAPKVSYFWSNFGNLYLRYGKISLAEKTFLHAIGLDSGNTSAISSLEQLYMAMGMQDKALSYRARIKKIREGNPYFLHMKAKAAYAKGNYQGAVDNSLLAIEKHEKDHRFYQVLGASYYKLDKSKEAEQALLSALSFANDLETQQHYQTKLQALYP